MPDKNFEQQIREQLQDIAMEHVPEVWPQVKATLHKNKKRRWLIWFFLMAAISVCGTYFFMNNKGENNKATSKKIVVKKSDKLKEDSVENESSKTKLVIRENKKNNYSKQTKKNKEISVAKNNNIQAKIFYIKKFPSNNRLDTIEQKHFELIQPAEIIVKQKNLINSFSAKNSFSGKKIFIDSFNLKNSVQNKISNDSAIKLPDSLNKISTKNSSKKSKINQWQLNIVTSAGISGVSNNFFNSIFSPSSADAAQYISNPGSPQQYSSPNFKNGFSFSVGMQLHKQLNKRNSIAGEIAYDLSQTKTKVGERIINNSADSIIYYANRDSLLYINYYHFFQLSANFYWQLNINHNFPMRLKLTAGAGFMFASNGLYYLSSSNIFVKENKLFYNPQLFVSPGFEFGIGKKSPLYVGPQFNYFITPFDKSSSKKIHLRSTSISFVIPIKKNK
ncbi:MAG: hypothetical protein ACR2FN_00225 [Chitinophagaceae bacterium]